MQLNNSYSLALYEIYKENKNKNQFYNDIQSLYLSFSKNNEIIKILSSRMLSKKERKKIIIDIFNKKINNYIQNFLLILIDDEYFNNLIIVLKSTLKKIDFERDQIFVIIESANNLDKNNLNKILDSIKKRWNKKIDYTLIINKNLICGIKIIINDKEIDQSIKGKLDELRREIQLKKRIG